MVSDLDGQALRTQTCALASGAGFDTNMGRDIVPIRAVRLADIFAFEIGYDPLEFLQIMVSFTTFVIKETDFFGTGAVQDNVLDLGVEFLEWNVQLEVVMFC